jgi:hypothetical protein
MTKRELIENIGGLSTTSKMPCKSFNLSAFLCNVGGKLSKIKGSVCYGCYAMTGHYRMYKNNITKAHERKIQRFTEDKTKWIESFIALLNRPEFVKIGLFRWFDSGDIYNYDMLLSIVSIAQNTPKIKHWLPTKEYSLVKKYESEFGKFPSNLVVRVSAPMMDVKLRGHSNTSSVCKNSEITESKTDRLCRAFENNNSCGDCTLCWNKNVTNITYKYH